MTNSFLKDSTIIGSSSLHSDLGENELIKILNKVSQHKALANFPILDEYVHYILKKNLQMNLVNLWNPKTLDLFPDIFKYKLIPLNKAHPQVPTRLVK